MCRSDIPTRVISGSCANGTGNIATLEGLRWQAADECDKSQVSMKNINRPVSSRNSTEILGVVLEIDKFHKNLSITEA